MAILDSTRRRLLKSPTWFIGTAITLATGCTPPGSASDDEFVTETSSEGDNDDETMLESSGPAETGVLSADELQSILTWLGPLPNTPQPDPSNAYADDPEAAALGQRLFFDPRYSENGEVSCATCHAPEDGFGDSRANVSLGIGLTSRASMGLLNGAYGSAAEGSTNWQLWDGRADSQWSQALGPPESATVMGSTRTRVALLLFDEYRSDYEAIFGAMPLLRDAQGLPFADPSFKPGMSEWDALPETVRNDVTNVYVNFGKALAAYERLLVSRNSRFDEFWSDLADGVANSDALTREETEGLRVFIGAGRCLGCHSGPNFTDNQFHNVAVPQIGDNTPQTDDGRASGVTKLLASEFNCTGGWSDAPDKSACEVNGINPGNGEIGAFRTPSLRSVSQTPPYMHTGNFQTLDEVIRHYDTGGAAPGTFLGTRDELLRPLALDVAQRSALVAFLASLEGEPLDPRLAGPP